MKIIYRFFYAFLFSCFLISISYASIQSDIQIDEIGRVIKYPGKIEVACPEQDKQTAVILAIGQSNSANHGSTRFETNYPYQVLSYFEGKCYIAASPLLGSTGIYGEFITPMADQLITNNDYEKIIIISFGIGGTTINEWEKGGYFNNMMQSILSKSKYTVTHIIWHQGESDFALHTPGELYKSRLSSLINSLRKPGSSFPMFYYAIASKCGENPEWTPVNPISIAQKSLENKLLNIIVGANTDELLLYDDRDLGRCHFSESGQLKTAQSFANAIHFNRENQ